MPVLPPIASKAPSAGVMKYSATSEPDMVIKIAHRGRFQFGHLRESGSAATPIRVLNFRCPRTRRLPTGRCLLRIKSCPGAPKETQTIAADNLYSRRNTNQHAARHSGELRSAFGSLPFVIDGAAVVLGIGGIADFNALQSGKQHGEVQFCAACCTC